MRSPLLVSLALAAALAACGGDSDPPAPPAIASFSAASATVHAGESTTLVASFTGGAGSISPDVGAVQSGTAVTVTPADDTTYTLTVTGAGGTVSSTAQVALAYDMAWPFDDVEGWALQSDGTGGSSAAVTGGELQISVSQFNDFQCHNAQASVTYGDAKMRAGGYQQVSFLFDGVERSRAGMGVANIDLVYGGQEVQFEVPDVFPAAPVRVDWGPTSIALVIGGVSTPLTGTSAPADAPPAITVSAGACAPDLAEASITIAAVSVAGR